MSEAYKKLIKTLRTLFEMDKADLDFGIYRILNQKRDEIDRFLEHDLLPQVKAAFADYAGGIKSESQAELDALVKTLTEAGIDPDQSPKVAQLRTQAASAMDITAVENEVYSHLHTFFCRYYDQGDFISLRRYKADIYAIPYEGEEVKLYWANHDQYYVKSSEHLRDYAFTVYDNDGKTVRIKLVEADTEKDNVKATADQDRRFVIDAEQPLSLDGKELQIRFHYVPVGKKKQDALNAEAVAIIFAQKGYKDWLNLLRQPAPTEDNSKRTLLEKHLKDYTARNTFDYFIHKNLGGFLRRELDFYIKSEVLHLDDIDDAALVVTEAHLRKIKVLRSIAHKIIRMLAQIEEFQKRLWLKKKFVVAAYYCVTLDRVPEALYPEIVANERQWEQWRSLGLWNRDGPGSVKDLTAQLFRMVDTSLFEVSFAQRLISSIKDLQKETNGIIMHGENFQALSLLNGAFNKRIGCVYIDPPYNAPKSEIAYKNNFKHSSFLSLIHNRLAVSKTLVNATGSHVVAIDKHEENGVARIISDLFPENDNVLVTIEHNRRGVQGDHFSHTNEYAIFSIPPGKGPLNQVAREEANYEWSNLRNWGGESLRSDAANCFYPIFVRDEEIIGFGEVWTDLNVHPAGANIKRRGGVIEVFPIDDNGVERKWRYERGTVEGIRSRLRVEKNRSGTVQIKIAKVSDQFKTVWYAPQYNAGDNGTGVARAMGLPIGEFDYPKSIYNTRDCLFAVSSDNDLVLDYFAGSGTTAQAVILLNREHGTDRRYILVEQGPYFESVLKARIQKTVFSANWANERPTLPESGLSHCFKVLKLESYEDVLNNLLVRPRSKKQMDLLDDNLNLREDYLLGYWLDVETAESPSLLNIDQFNDPFNYKLNIATGSVGAFNPSVVDLVETFNYLLGLRVEQIGTICSFQVVTGTNPQDKSVLVIWRKVKEQDNSALEVFMTKHGYNPRDTKFDHIYVNGDHTLDDPFKKVKMTEIEFKRLMFDAQDF